MDSLASRLYYVDPDVIVSDSPQSGGPVLYFRDGVKPLSELKVILRRLNMVITDGLQTDSEGNKYYPLEVQNG